MGEFCGGEFWSFYNKCNTWANFLNIKKADSRTHSEIGFFYLSDKIFKKIVLRPRKK